MYNEVDSLFGMDDGCMIHFTIRLTPGDGRDELVAGRGPHPDADTRVKVFMYNGASVSQWISLEAYPDLTHGTNVAAGRF